MIAAVTLPLVLVLCLLGLTSIAATQDYDEAMFDRVIGVNLKGAFLGLRHVLPVMLRQGALVWS